MPTRSLSAVAAVTVVAGAAVALLASGGQSGAGTPAATSGSSRPQTAAPNPATGTIAFARHTRAGTFGDASGPLVEVTPDGAVVGNLPLQRTCCLTQSTTTRRFAMLVAGPGPLRLVSTGGGFTSDIPLPTRHTTLRLNPGAWSPNGKVLAMAGVDPARPARDGVYAMSVSGGDLHRLTSAPRGRPQRPLAYSPDGLSLLVFQRDRNGRFGTLYVTRRDGRVARVSNPGAVTCCYFGSPASWSPDGRSIAFASFTRRRGVPPGLSAVFVASATGGNAHRITDPGEWTTSARWSPSGDWIAFDKAGSGGFHSVFLTHPDGSDVHMVDPDPAATGSCCAQWSPDGRYLVYEHVEQGSDNHVALYVVNVDGPAHRRRITGANGSYMSFGWVP
jgi:Tol biopolymer transport system component